MRLLTGPDFPALVAPGRGLRESVARRRPGGAPAVPPRPGPAPGLGGPPGLRDGLGPARFRCGRGAEARRDHARGELTGRPQTLIDAATGVRCGVRLCVNRTSLQSRLSPEAIGRARKRPATTRKSRRTWHGTIAYQGGGLSTLPKLFNFSCAGVRAANFSLVASASIAHCWLIVRIAAKCESANTMNAATSSRRKTRLVRTVNGFDADEAEESKGEGHEESPRCQKEFPTIEDLLQQIFRFHGSPLCLTPRLSGPRTAEQAMITRECRGGAGSAAARG